MGDSGYPNYLTVGADGSAGGVFPGGVQIPSNPFGVDDRAVQWFRESDLARVARLYGLDSGTSGELRAQGTGPGNPAGEHADLSLLGSPGLSAVAATAFDSTPRSAGVDVITSAGASSFLQLAAGSAKRKVAFGSTVLHFAAANLSAASGPIAHGLGAAPLLVATGITGAGSGAVFTAMVGATDATNLNLQAGCTTAVTFDVTVWWLAIG